MPDLPPTPYEPERAKALLAEAGFPKGLRITIHGPNDRYVNDAKIIQAVAQMWQRIGVQTTVEAMPWNTYVARAGKLEFSVFLLGWGVGERRGAQSAARATRHLEPRPRTGHREPRPLFQSRRSTR